MLRIIIVEMEISECGAASATLSNRDEEHVKEWKGNIRNSDLFLGGPTLPPCHEDREKSQSERNIGLQKLGI